jgi:hypothetical protein
VCSRKKARLAFLVIEAGILTAFTDNLPCRYIVLTTSSKGLDPKPLQEAWNRLRERIADRGLYFSYALAIETDPKGRPHLNLITVGGKSMKQRDLCALASRAGFGGNVYVKAVCRTPKDAHKLASYATKSPRETVLWAHARGSQRFRPIRLSTRWRPCNLTEARRVLPQLLGYENDAGPFVLGRIRRGHVHELERTVESPDEGLGASLWD